MSFLLRISDRSRKAGRFIGRVHREIQKAFVDSGLKQSELARKLEIDRATLNKRICGQSNLTLRSIADIAWALDQDIEFSFRRKDGRNNNFSVHAGTPRSVSTTDVLETSRIWVSTHRMRETADA